MLHSWGTLGLDWHGLAGFVRAQYDMRRTNDSQQFYMALNNGRFHSAWLNRLFALDISFWGHFEVCLLKCWGCGHPLVQPEADLLPSVILLAPVKEQSERKWVGAFWKLLLLYGLWCTVCAFFYLPSLSNQQLLTSSCRFLHLMKVYESNSSPSPYIPAGSPSLLNPLQHGLLSFTVH